MNSSPAQTGTVGAAIACIAALLSVTNRHWTLGMTPDDIVAISSGLPVLAHWLAQQYAVRQAAQIAAPASAAPAQVQ